MSIKINHLCLRCFKRLKTRSFSSNRHSSTSTRYIAPLPNRSVLQISGPDAQKFLKGLSTKDVEETGGGYSGFLNASGRVLHTAFIFPVRQPDQQPISYLISYEAFNDQDSPLMKMMLPFRLRSRVKIQDVSPNWSSWASWGGNMAEQVKDVQRAWKLGSGGAAEAIWKFPSGGVENSLPPGVVSCWDLRAGSGENEVMQQILVPVETEASTDLSCEIVSKDDYNLRRMLLGLPEGPHEIASGSALPLESCMDIHGGVDFRKGCYLGQELTVRTYHTGATRKRILPVRLFSLESEVELLETIQAGRHGPPTIAASDMEITYHPPIGSASSKPRSAGRILALHDTQTSVGLALVRLELADRCWHNGQIPPCSLKDWLKSGVARLTITIDGKQWGVFVEHGSAYQASLGQDTS